MPITTTNLLSVIGQVKHAGEDSTGKCSGRRVVGGGALGRPDLRRVIWLRLPNAVARQANFRRHLAVVPVPNSSTRNESRLAACPLSGGVSWRIRSFLSANA